MTYLFLQHYWWFLVSLLGALLVFLLFVQGANSMIFHLGDTPEERRLLVNCTGRKWELTFTTLVTFGGAFFASFPLFYSTSFGGAYWLWMVILFTFVVQAVSYEFQNKLGNFLGSKTFQVCLVINGLLGPFLLGCAVATFFNGSNFVVDKGNITDTLSPVISHWANASHGLDALLDPWNLVLGVAVLLLARVLGLLYVINNVRDEKIQLDAHRLLPWHGGWFLASFLVFIAHVLMKDGYVEIPETGEIVSREMQYLINFTHTPVIGVVFLVGVVLVLAGILLTMLKPLYTKGIWFTGTGTVLTVLALLLVTGWNHTAYYPSNFDPQSSLTLANSCSSEFTLRTMAIVSVLIPFVLAYIIYAWRAIDRKKLTKDEISKGEAY